MNILHLSSLTQLCYCISIHICLLWLTRRLIFNLDICRLGWRMSVSQMTTDMLFVVSTIRFYPNSWPVTGFVARITRLVLVVKRELLTVAKQLDLLDI